MAMESSSVSLKRKRSCHVEEEENEEEKIDKFFRLIKSIRDARDRLMMQESENNRKKKIVEEKVEKEGEKQKLQVWKPSFQLEDFMEDAPPHYFNTSTVVALVSHPSSQNTDDQLQGSPKKEDTKQGLDLRLSL